MNIIEQVGRAGIKIYGRDKNGKLYVETDNSFKPYFYNDKRERIEVFTPSDVQHRRRMYPKTYESDIPYPQRYLIDKIPIPMKKEPLRICYLDIETANACLDVDTTPEPIMSVTCYDNFLKKYVTFVWREDVIPKTEKSSNHSTFFFNSEIRMLEKFTKFINETDPDVFTGWAVDRFDMKYIINRFRVLNLNPNKLSRENYTAIQERMQGRYFDIVVKGRIVFDLLRAYKKLYSSTYNSLDYVAKKELGLDKGKPYLRDLWENLDTLIEYNRHDVELCVLIDKKKMLIDFYNTLRLLCGSVWKYTFEFSMLNDVLLLRKAKERGEILPTRTYGKREKFEGGFVLTTKPGVHKGVMVMDLKSLYPSIILQFNMSTETISKEGDLKLGNGISFKSEPEGLIPSMIEYLINERDKVKKKMRQTEYGSIEYKSLYAFQFAMKFVINAVYGATAYPNFRLFNPDIAKSITWIGRECIKWTKQVIEDYSPDLKVIYADTDSCIIRTNKENLEEILEIRAKLEKVVNDSYTEFVKQFGCKENKYLLNRAEKVYIKFLETNAKKRYAGRLVWVDGEKKEPTLDITGFEAIRSDFNPFGQKFQQELFNLLLDGKKKKDIEGFVAERKKEFQKIPLDQIAIPKGIKSKFEDYKVKQAHVRGAEYANKYLGERIFAGDKIKMIYVKGVKGKPSTNVICFTQKVPEGLDVNWEKMEQLTFTNKLDKVYDAMGWISKTQDLGKWFKHGSAKTK